MLHEHASNSSVRSAVRGGYDPETGKIYTGCSANPVNCAEVDIERQIGRGTDAPVFTKTFGWRVEIPVCVNCQARCNSSQFPPDVLSDKDGPWSRTSRWVVGEK